MSNIVLFDPEGVVVNRVTSYLQSVNDPDYDSFINKIINPDISRVVTIDCKYWKANNGCIVEMTVNEKSVIDDFLNAKTLRINKYKILKYDSMNRLTKETLYDTDNKDGTYSGKAEDTVYTYSENDNSVLLYKITTVYYYDGTVAESVKTEYYKNDNNEIIEKKV